MKIQTQDKGIMYDALAAKIDGAAKPAPGPGLFLQYRRWCFKCAKDKPALGARQVRPGVFKCADCLQPKQNADAEAK